MDAELERRWERDGFLVVPDFVDAATCATLKDQANALVAAHAPTTVSVFSTNEQTRTSDDYFLESGDKISFFYEEEAASGKAGAANPFNKIGHALHTLDPVFAPFSQRSAHLELVRSLGLARPALVQSMYIFKNAFIGGDVSCHQDATFLHTTPLSVVGLWFALEDATIENGCMWALPGGHRGPLRKRFARAPAGGTVMHILDETPYPPVATAAPWVPLEAKAGTMVLLHGLLPHFSCANRSARSRHAYALHYVDDAAEWTRDNWLRR